MGWPFWELAVTFPLLSVVTVAQLNTSTSSVFPLYPVSETDQDVVAPLDPTLVRSASIGDLLMARDVVVFVGKVI